MTHKKKERKEEKLNRICSPFEEKKRKICQSYEQFMSFFAENFMRIKS